jgi:hypothetical protein
MGNSKLQKGKKIYNKEVPNSKFVKTQKNPKLLTPKFREEFGIFEIGI